MKFQVIDKNGNIRCEEDGEGEITLFVNTPYEEGDHIVFLADQVPAYYLLQLDDALGESFSYVTGKVDFVIPFGEKRISYSPKVFAGEKHYLHARIATEREIPAYRNLALNVNDAHGDTHLYPHASANVETRGESVFAARNAVDGVLENRSHGEWPYESWGINMQDDAEITIDFGHEVKTDRIVLYTRSDFPHDNWWTQVTFTFSDGSVLEFPMKKSQKPHELIFPAKKISCLKMSKLVKAEDPSPFPALSQIQVWGTIEE